VHAIDLEEQFGHIPPPPMQIGCRIQGQDANVTPQQAGWSADRSDSRRRARF
jgi:hypothetical protein